MSELIAVILAAGKGTRMKSALPKVLHRVCGKAMVSHVLDAAKAAGARRNVVVVGFGAEAVREALSDAAEVVVQEEQLGTGHAVLQTETCLAGERGTVMILCGDTPLLTTALLKRLYDAHVTSKAQATVLTAILPDATGYGRVIRTAAGDVEKIVEHKDATEDERKVREVNAGIYCFEKEALFAALRKVGCDNAQGEYYLPDALAIIREAGGKIAALAADDFEETLGVNSRAQLAEAEKILRRRKNRALMDEGVTLMDPDSTFVDTDVIVGRDTVIYPFTWLEGATTVGEGCVLGPSSRFSDARIGDGVTAHFVYAHECEIGDGVTMGPYVHLRPGTKLAKDVKIGNFVEVKNSVIGEGSKLPHLQYIGDCDMGAGVNMGCGTITVNYDGKNKFRTTIGDRAFVGCNSNLVAPVSVGNDAYIAAGSTVTRDVPPENLAVARARQKNIPNWSDRRL